MSKYKRRGSGGRNPDFLTFFERVRLTQHAREFEARREIRALLRLENILYTRLERLLSTGSHPILMRYSDTINTIAEKQQTFFYRRGYIDAITLVLLLAAIG